MKKVYWSNYLFALILMIPIFYFSEKYLDLPLIYHYLITINIVTFAVFGLDELSAVRNIQRIPEIVLYILSAIGGFIGFFAGMFFFRHKIRRASFFLWPLFCLLAYLAIFDYLNLLPSSLELFKIN